MFEHYNYDGETDLWCNVSVEQIPVGVMGYISLTKNKIHVVYINVTLSHLRSEEFQRMHKPCIPHHWDTSVQMYPGKVVALLKEEATFIKVITASIDLMWMRCLSLFVLYKLRQQLIVGINQY